MKKLIIMATMVISVYAVDYNTMSLDELSNLRGTVPVEERGAFRSAFQEKLKYLTPDEQGKYTRGNGQGIQNKNMNQIKQRVQDGSGTGSMYQGSRGFGGGSSGGGKGGGR
jgi:uncharacterized membrane protein YgcG